MKRIKHTQQQFDSFAENMSGNARIRVYHDEKQPYVIICTANPGEPASIQMHAERVATPVWKSLGEPDIVITGCQVSQDPAKKWATAWTCTFDGGDCATYTGSHWYDVDPWHMRVCHGSTGNRYTGVCWCSMSFHWPSRWA